MKRILALIACLIGLSGGMITHAQNAPDEAFVASDLDTAMVDVIGWFCKNDTIDYWINQSKWKIADGDTVKTASVSTKVRIIVTDSTDTGYKMDYTFMGCVADSIDGKVQDNFQSKIVSRLGNKIVGTTIKFETNEEGKIIRFTNFDKIKKQARELYKECMKELLSIKEIKELKKDGLDLKKLMDKYVDMDQLVEGYTEELNLLFLYHGSSFPIGESQEHEDATDEKYENDTHIAISTDPEDGAYHISTDIVNKVPKELIKSTIGNIVNLFTDEKKKDTGEIKVEMRKGMDEVLTEDGTINDYLCIDYMPHGWPYKVVKQRSVKIAKTEKLEQTYIRIESYSLGNNY